MTLTLSKKQTRESDECKDQSTGSGWKAHTGDNRRGHARRLRIEETRRCRMFHGWMPTLIASGLAGGELEKGALD